MSRREPGSKQRFSALPWTQAGHLVQEAVHRLIDAYAGDPYPHGLTHKVNATDPLPAPLAVQPVRLNVNGSIGSGPSYAREDHKHGLDLLLTTKGDMLVFDGGQYVRFPVGADGKFLKADSGQAVGLLWADAPAGGGGGDLGDSDLLVWVT